MQYCPNCGTPVEGRYCPKCGTAMQAPGGYSAPPPPPGGYGAPPPGATGLGSDENVAAALCYIPIVGLIFLLIDPYK
ncbi:MAG: hypothetical protein JO022_16280, partial [Acidobacteriaceae bacterium]|nr:hypothetical protein [Acidobacteriaceae bacterium]